MRCRPDGVRGVMEALIARSIEEARRRGLAEVRLGLAPLAITPGHADDLFNRALRDIYGRLDRFRRSRSLRHFKSKFAPAWEERYLAVPSTAALPEVLAALLRAHLPSLAAVVQAARAAAWIGDSRPAPVDRNGIITARLRTNRMRAYMFINAMRGQSLALIKEIRTVPGVQDADAITGDYDIVASVQARDLAELRTTMAGVQAIEGILRTTTSIVLSGS